MGETGEGDGVERVQFFLRQGRCRGRDENGSVAVELDEGTAHLMRFPFKEKASFQIGARDGQHGFMGWQFDVFPAVVFDRGEIFCTHEAGSSMDARPEIGPEFIGGEDGKVTQKVGYSVQPAGRFQNRPFAHAAEKEIEPGVEKQRATQFIRPEVVVGDPAQGCLDAARGQRQARKGAAHEVGVDDDRPVRARSGLASRRVGVVMSFAPKGRIVGKHGIQRPGADAREKPGTSHGRDGGHACSFVLPYWLRHNSRAIAVRHEPAPEQRHSEGRMIHIGVSGHKQNVQLVPVERVHFAPGHGQDVRLGQWRTDGEGKVEHEKSVDEVSDFARTGQPAEKHRRRPGYVNGGCRSRARKTTKTEGMPSVFVAISDRFAFITAQGPSSDR